MRALVFSVLVAAGAALDPCDDDGTALDNARKQRHKPVVAVLEMALSERRMAAEAKLPAGMKAPSINFKAPQLWSGKDGGKDTGEAPAPALARRCGRRPRCTAPGPAARARPRACAS